MRAESAKALSVLPKSTLLPLAGRPSSTCNNPGCRFALPWAMRKLPLQGAQESQGALVALFVPTSSAALGIAFKASLMLCSHLHEQSGRTRIKGAPIGVFLYIGDSEWYVAEEGAGNGAPRGG